MKTIEINVFTYSELSDKAKENAFNSWSSEDHEYFWGDENRKTLEIFERAFPVKVTNFEYGGGGKYISWEFTGTDKQRELSGVRLYGHILHNYFSDIYKGKYYGKLVYTFPDGTPIPKSKEHPIGARHVKRYSRVMFDNSCVFTGYCVDDDILDPVYKFLDKPNSKTDFEDLMNDCLHSWLFACNNDSEYQNSQEYFEEEAEANEFEFDEEGNKI